MDLTVHRTLLRDDDPDAAVTSHRASGGRKPGNDVGDVGHGALRGLTLRAVDQPDVLAPIDTIQEVR